MRPRLLDNLCDTKTLILGKTSYTMHHVVFIGLGYIGLPTASLIAVSGHTVTGVDINHAAVARINACQTSFKEPGLDALVREAVHSGRFHATTSPVEADIFVIAVPTPVEADTAPDMSYVRSAAQSLAPCLRPGNLVILESTSPVGATEQVRQWVANIRGTADDIHFAYSPERIIPGNMLHELRHNDRVVGGLTPESTRLAAEFYRTFVQGTVMETTARTAELTKLAENSYRDVNIAFANELSLLAEKYGIDPWELIRFTNRHPRVNILQPGPGVGGHCIAIDPWFLVHDNPEETPLIATARKVNLGKTEHVFRQILAACHGKEAPVIACMGLTYKPDTEDLRESPALSIARRLSGQDGLTVLCCEPNCTKVPDLTLVSIEEALSRADILVWLVRHKEFLALTVPARVYVMDTCGVTRV